MKKLLLSAIIQLALLPSVVWAGCIGHACVSVKVESVELGRGGPLIQTSGNEKLLDCETFHGQLAIRVFEDTYSKMKALLEFARQKDFAVDIDLYDDMAPCFIRSVSIHSSPRQPADLDDYFQCLAVPDKQSVHLCAMEPDGAYPHWYLLTSGQLSEVDIDTAGLRLSQVEFFPSGRFMAIVSTAEGHPLLQVFATHLLLERNHVEFLQSWDPYPGWIQIGSWQGDTLIVESNVPLHENYDRTADFDEDVTYRFRWSVDEPKLQLMRPSTSSGPVP